MSITSLVEVVTPPDRSESSLSIEVCSRPEMTYPADYSAYCETYGTGRFCGGFILVMSATHHRYDRWLQRKLNSLQVEADAGYLGGNVLYKEGKGLFPWGNDENGNILCWNASNESPNEWPVVVAAHGGGIECWNMQMTSFLAEAIQGDIQVQVWHDGFEDLPRDFRPLS